MWYFTNDRPIYVQLIEQIGIRIVNGSYAPGEKLPSVRDMASEVEANPNTVQRAFSELERSGIISTQRTNGRFITEDKEMIAKMREDLAKEKIEEFIKVMKDFGYDAEEISRVVANYAAGKEEA
ncbi:MAG: GntR family transcriptional regulator [Lachnospiraceae bacterium]|nr:GntR family transcriptional regulator [Lachnospiraceae bacterium]